MDSLYVKVIEKDIYEIQTDDGKRFQLMMQVREEFYDQITGAESGSTRKQLQGDTMTNILVPKTDPADNSIIIEGGSKDSVIAAKLKIDRIVRAGQAMLPLTHFLTIPFTNDEIGASFMKFKNDVLKDSETPDDLEPLFGNPKRLHFKLLFLVLPDIQNTIRPLECLEECKTWVVDKFLKDGPLQVRMAGLSSNSYGPFACRKLYANVISDKLQGIVDEIGNFFKSRGIIRRE